MEKIVYLIWAPADQGDDLRDRLLTNVVEQWSQLGGRGITVNVHDAEAAKAPSPVPVPEGENPHVAELSVWLDTYERHLPFDQSLRSINGSVAAYLVAESLYEDYGTTAHCGPRDWPDATRSPGVLTVSLIHRPADLDYATWIERWHGTQSPLSAELQPRCRYVRNEVIRTLTPGAPTIDGIVEEAWPSIEHVADPMLFFNAGGDADRLTANITSMLDSVVACLDLERLRNSTMSEYLVSTIA